MHPHRSPCSCPFWLLCMPWTYHAHSNPVTSSVSHGLCCLDTRSHPTVSVCLVRVCSFFKAQPQSPFLIPLSPTLVSLLQEYCFPPPCKFHITVTWLHITSTLPRGGLYLCVFVCSMPSVRVEDWMVHPPPKKREMSTFWPLEPVIVTLYGKGGCVGGFVDAIKLRLLSWHHPELPRWTLSPMENVLIRGRRGEVCLYRHRGKG